MTDTELKEYLSSHNIPITNLTLFRQAITHRSFLGQDEQNDISLYNGSLEFLGDAILNFVISDHLYCSYPNKSEGELSQLTSAIVAKNILFDVSQHLHISSVLRHKIDSAAIENATFFNPSADAIEAIIAGVYIEGGVELARAFILEVFAPFIENAMLGLHVKDYKSLLQDYTQKTYHTKPNYVLTLIEGEDHKKIFSVEVRIGTSSAHINNLLQKTFLSYGPSKGRSRKVAEQQVAKTAYLALNTQVE